MKFHFSHPLEDMVDMVVLETVMSVLYDLTPCDPKTFSFNSWPSSTLYDHTMTHMFFSPVLLSTSRVTTCVSGIQKNLTVRVWSTELLSFYNTKQRNHPQNKRGNNDISRFVFNLRSYLNSKGNVKNQRIRHKRKGMVLSYQRYGCWLCDTLSPRQCCWRDDVVE